MHFCPRKPFIKGPREKPAGDHRIARDAAQYSNPFPGARTVNNNSASPCPWPVQLPARDNSGWGCKIRDCRQSPPRTFVGYARTNVEEDCRYDEHEGHGLSSLASSGCSIPPSITIALALAPGLIRLGPAVIRVRIAKSAVARNDQRGALFQRSHAAIVPDVLPDVFYSAPRTLVGSAGANIQQHCSHHDGEDENESHDRLPTKR